jgi:hypothetical protein
MSAFAVLASEIAHVEEASTLPSKWVFGGVTLAVLLLMLFVTTRFNIDR